MADLLLDCHRILLFFWLLSCMQRLGTVLTASSDDELEVRRTELFKHRDFVEEFEASGSLCCQYLPCTMNTRTTNLRQYNGQDTTDNNVRRVTKRIRYDTIRYDSVYLTCSKKLTDSQLSLPHVTNKKYKIKKTKKVMNMISLVQFYDHEGSPMGKEEKLRSE